MGLKMGANVLPDDAAGVEIDGVDVGGLSAGGVVVWRKPAAPTESVTFALNARQIAAGAAGRFRGEINWTFTLGGREYTITGIFTHNNGWQIGLNAVNDLAPFVAANFTIDTGITGQPTFRSGIMETNQGAGFLQYRAFAGGYFANGNYTVTISA